ncbi:MAG: TIM barrel protein [Romboutsia sp.]
MIVGISALIFNIEEAINLCNEIEKINHIEVGIDNLYDCRKLYKYKDRIEELNLSIGIHLPLELNTCENIEYIRDSWIDFTNQINNELIDFNIKYFNLHLGYVISNRLKKNKEKYLDNSIKFLDKLNKELDSKIIIENVYSNNGDFSNVGNTIYDFEYIFNRNKSDKLWFCYDTGHYLINNDDYINSLKYKTKLIHLSDNYP